MFEFTFTYTDGTSYLFKNVTRLVVPSSSGLKEFPATEIPTAQIPLSNMWLYTDDGCISISGQNLLIVKVIKQND